MDATSTLTRSDRAIVEDVGGETVILNLDDDSFLRLNAAGAVLWKALEEPRSLGSLAAALQEQFGIDEPTARTDTSAFVEDMGRRGLLSVG